MTEKTCSENRMQDSTVVQFRLSRLSDKMLDAFIAEAAKNSSVFNGSVHDGLVEEQLRRTRARAGQQVPEEIELTVPALPLAELEAAPAGLRQSIANLKVFVLAAEDDADASQLAVGLELMYRLLDAVEFQRATLLGGMSGTVN